MPLGGLVIAGAGLAYGAYKSERNSAKANAIQKNLKDPVYHIPGEFYQNREIARQMATLGLPQQQYNNAVNGINQNNAAGLATLSRSANPGSGVAAVTRQSDNAMNSLTAEDAQARQANERYFIGQNGQLGNQELAKQQSDVFDKYTRDFNQMQAYKGAAETGMNNTISGAGQLGMTALNYASNNPNTSPVGNVAATNGAAQADISATQNQMNNTASGFNSYLAGQSQQNNNGVMGANFQTPQFSGTGLPSGVPYQRQNPYRGQQPYPGLPYNWGQ